MLELKGAPSDEVGAILATGRSGVSRMFVSMSARDPAGADEDYLAWHCRDHRPEQYRLAELRASIRVVSTPACRAARAVSSPDFDAVDHVMTYFFSDEDGLKGFGALAVALRDVGRMDNLLPSVHSGVYAPTASAAAPWIKAGADVLPWWPAKGVYLLVSETPADIAGLLAVDGVVGVWQATAAGSVDDAGVVETASSLSLTYCFLDDDPVAVAGRMGSALDTLASRGVRVHLAAPFQVVDPHDLGRNLP